MPSNILFMKLLDSSSIIESIRSGPLPKISINSSFDKKNNLGNLPLFFSKNSVSPALIVSLS